MVINRKKFRLAIDTGGTFVDAVEFNDEESTVRLAKSPTTPDDPSIGVLNVIQKLGTPLKDTYMIIYGTTLGINAIIQRKGASTGLITNEGFRDIFEIGRGDVPPKYMYDFNYFKPKPLIRRRMIIGVPCRINYKGEVIQDLDVVSLRSRLEELFSKDSVQSLAVCFLHSYRNPEHEYRALEIIHEMFPNIPVSLSCEVAREYREYERTATTVLDAYIKPIVSNHISKLERSLKARGFSGILLIMRSDGGVMSASHAARSPIRTIQSGPAGGVIGAINYGRLLGLSKIISIDVGGTSLDACVILNNQANVMHQTQIEHYPILLTTFDIRSIGAGGGSIAYLDGKLLKVGPESAGSDPGPMCYSRGGTKPTVTDAAICLGYIEPGRFLSGEMPLNGILSIDGIRQQIATPLELSVEEAAAGIFKVMIANSSSAIRQITVEEGLDPEEFTMIAFGGAGPMIAPVLAREVNVPRVVVPIAPANFSAFGMLMTDIKTEASQTVLEKLSANTVNGLETAFRGMTEKLLESIADLRANIVATEVKRSLEMRYVGQEHMLEVDLDIDDNDEMIKKKFNELHFRRYGHAMDYEIEVVNARVTVIGVLKKPRLMNYNVITGEKKMQSRKAYCLVTDKVTDFCVLRRDALKVGEVVSGPAIVDEDVCTTVIHTGQALTVDRYGDLIIEV